MDRDNVDMALTAKMENGTLSNADSGVVDSLDVLEWWCINLFGNEVASGATLNDSCEMWAFTGPCGGLAYVASSDWEIVGLGKNNV